MNKKNFILINDIKNYFESQISKKLNLTKIPAPLFLAKNTYLNDELNGIEKSVNFEIYDMDREAEIIHSLAKWKRVALKKYSFKQNEGIVTDMKAVRRNEITDNIHSILVDQWDWEVIINKNQRNKKTLIEYAQKVYSAVVSCQNVINKKYKLNYNNDLPNKLFVIDSQELLDMYPNDSSKQREYKITKKYHAVLITSIGHKLNNGIEHDLRSPEYDDWNLNGDILVWSNAIKQPIELSSMGVRVDKNSLKHQLELKNMRVKTDYHNDIIESNLPFTIGGGIGQSRVVMFIMNKKHIGEVQVSEWTEKELKENKFIL